MQRLRWFDNEAVGRLLNFAQVCGVVRSGQTALAAGGVWRFVENLTLRACRSTQWDGGTLRKMKGSRSCKARR
jgi:hypothetical protein